MSAATMLRIEPEVYEAASHVLGEGVAQALAEQGFILGDELAATSGMAGTDASGVDWATAYDRSTAAAMSCASDLITAGFRLAALLQATGCNYERAESASVPGAQVVGVDRDDYSGRACRLAAPPAAAGSGGGAPPGWSLVESAVGYLWPNGHQDRLRAAATAWRRFAGSVRASADYVPRAYSSLHDQLGPETDDAITTCRSYADQLHGLASEVEELATSCSHYADELDAAHAAVEDELVSLLDWTAAIEAGGAVLSIVTLGGSEAVAQGIEAARIAATAGRIGALLDRLAGVVRAAAEVAANAGYRLQGLAEGLRPLLESRVVMAIADSGEPVRVVRTAAGAAEERLVATADRAELGPPMKINTRQFGHKIGKHAGEFSLDPKAASSRATLSRIVERIRAHPDEVRCGPWHPNSGGGVDYWFYRQGADVVVTKGDGSFVTVLKDGAKNGWFQGAGMQ